MLYVTAKEISARGKISILVDDGIATGLTMRAAIRELKYSHPKKIVIAVPLIPESIAMILRCEVDEVIAFDFPPEDEFLDTVSAYYQDFSPVEDEEVISILKQYKQERLGDVFHAAF
ncbi:MAG: hypothetical protein KBD46_00360 [Candidatus Levybacteria bacterium]|nr:hypothetical protein [Candidatus Levybacteria bacterium]